MYARKGKSSKPTNNKVKFSKQDALIAEIHKHREDQAKSIEFRRNLLERQRRANYINEYDRIKGALESGTVQGLHVDLFKKRQDDLKKLAKHSLNPSMYPDVYPSRHEIFNKK